MQTLRESLDVYKHVFLLKFENLRSSRMRDVRMDWKESRIFLGKNSIAQVALGRTVEEEYKDNLHLISQVSCMLNTTIELKSSLFILCIFAAIGRQLWITVHQQKQERGAEVSIVSSCTCLSKCAFHSNSFLKLLFKTAPA